MCACLVIPSDCEWNRCSEKAWPQSKPCLLRARRKMQHDLWQWPEGPV